MPTATDQLIDGQLIHLPPEAGDVNEPRFNPNEDWLCQAANPAEQKTAMWRWFASRYEDPVVATPHDTQGNYEYKDGGPYYVDRVLHERFDDCVPRDVIDELVLRVQQEVGNEWGLKGLDKFGG
jgi:hypothetical protein